MKKFFLYTGITVAILLLLYFGVSYWLVHSTRTRVTAQRQAIADAGDPVYLTDYEIEDIPDEENAYFYLMQASDDLEKFEVDWTALADLDFERRLTPEQVKSLTELVDKYGPLYEQLEQAAACQQYQPDVNYADGVAMEIPHLMQHRNAVRAIAAKTIVAAYQSDGDTALKHCQTALRLSALLRDEPTLVGHLVHIACQAIAVESVNHVLRVADTSAEARANVDERLAQIDNRQAAVDAMKGERATGVLTFQQVRDGTLNAEDLDAAPIGVFGRTWLGQAYLNDDEAKYIELLDKQIETAELSKLQRDKAMQPVWDELEQSGFRHILSRMLVPALNAAVDATDRQDARVRSLRVLLAIEGEANVDLDSVKLPDAATTDPFNGRPLLLDSIDGEWKVYSVGKNLIDDGGDIYGPTGNRFDDGLGPLLPPIELPDVIEQ